MEKRIRKVADCYTKFGLQHTSKSTACLKHSDRLFKKILFPKETSKLNNASFKGGNIVHDVVQLFVTEKHYETIDDVINSDKIQKEIASSGEFLASIQSTDQIADKIDSRLQIERIGL